MSDDSVTLSVNDGVIELNTEQSSGGGTTNYNLLDNKPCIAGVVLVGDKTYAEMGIAQRSATTPLMDGDASAGTENLYAAGDHVHPHDSTKVDAEEGKVLSSNDFTDALKDKLDAIDGTATSLVTPRTIDGVAFDGSSAITHYGVCETAAGTATKTVPCTGFSLVTGATVIVLFSNTNTASVSSLAMDVNGTGATEIRRHGAELPNTSALSAGCTYEFVFDGTYWQLVGDIDNNSETPTGVTGVKGSSESTYRTGNVSLSAANVGAAASSHTHSMSDITSGVLAVAQGGTGTSGYGSTASAWMESMTSYAASSSTSRDVSVSLAAGTWLITYGGRADVSGAAVIDICLSNSSTSPTADDSRETGVSATYLGVSGIITTQYLRGCAIMTLSSASTVYLYSEISFASEPSTKQRRFGINAFRLA